MSKVSMEKRISLEPKFLTEKIRLQLGKRLEELYLGYCDQKYGYILKIYDDFSIKSNKLSTTDRMVFFDIQFNAKVLMPKIGNEYTGIVTKIYPQGIFVQVEEILKILIPEGKMKEYKYTNGTYKSKKDTIKVGDEISLVIDMIKYEEQKFNCIGSLVGN